MRLFARGFYCFLSFGGRTASQQCLLFNQKTSPSGQNVAFE
jgi:hypothetical protein